MDAWAITDAMADRDRAELERIVAASDKQRLPSTTPVSAFAPTRGTASSWIPAGRRQRRRPCRFPARSRGSCERVGRRRGVPVVLGVDSGTRSADGAEFFRSVNGVWLTGHVPARYLTLDGRPLSG